jgi:hypothetical protein
MLTLLATDENKHEIGGKVMRWTADDADPSRERPSPRKDHRRNLGVKTLMEVRYKADITAGALKLPESRIIAGLLLQKLSPKEWEEAIVRKNVLQASTAGTAKRLSRLIRARLEPMGPVLWKMVRDGSWDVATFATFAAAIKHSQLLADFLLLVVAQRHRTFNRSLTKSLWEEFLGGCEERDPSVSKWSESTKRRLGSTIFQMLAQAKFLDSTRSLQLQAVHVPGEVLSFLQIHNETHVLRCIQVAS